MEIYRIAKYSHLKKEDRWILTNFLKKVKTSASSTFFDFVIAFLYLVFRLTSQLN